MYKRIYIFFVTLILFLGYNYKSIAKKGTGGKRAVQKAIQSPYPENYSLGLELLASKGDPKRFRAIAPLQVDLSASKKIKLWSTPFKNPTNGYVQWKIMASYEDGGDEKEIAILPWLNIPVQVTAVQSGSVVWIGVVSVLYAIEQPNVVPAATYFSLIQTSLDGQKIYRSDERFLVDEKNSDISMLPGKKSGDVFCDFVKYKGLPGFRKKNMPDNREKWSFSLTSKGKFIAKLSKLNLKSRK